MSNQSLLDLLEKFVKGWNDHDVEALMECMTPDACVFYTPAGAGERGDAFSGFEAVKGAYSAVFEKFPDGQWTNARHFVAGNRGVSEWLFVGSANGQKVVVNGVDLFEFENGKIKVKDSYRKQRV
ncbi:MAG: nuclear transport factor 2 family protein [Desulfovibrionaceae bacterium]|nr:nuclear transport factor 2 family protein [Desulfovibrionaceae bacterium]